MVQVLIPLVLLSDVNFIRPKIIVEMLELTEFKIEKKKKKLLLQYNKEK